MSKLRELLSAFGLRASLTAPHALVVRVRSSGDLWGALSDDSAAPFIEGRGTVVVRQVRSALASAYVRVVLVIAAPADCGTYLHVPVTEPSEPQQIRGV
jgi:hypothetical protein